eukprot:scaffold46848_cov30-Tisochrysis_lutea.AAC.3
MRLVELARRHFQIWYFGRPGHRTDAKEAASQRARLARTWVLRAQRPNALARTCECSKGSMSTRRRCA